ncbi:MAG: ABC transporter substrate-binding protein, partial [Mesorhizobium sp.]
MLGLLKTVGLGMLVASTLAVTSLAHAEDIKLMDGVAPRPDDTRMTAAGAFKKDPPWVIGMSDFGVNANTWTVQVAHEAENAAAKDKRISKFILLDAGFDQKKQVADIEDLI